MQYINDVKQTLDQSTVEVVMYDKNGVEVNDDSKSMALVKKIESKKEKTYVFFVSTHAGILHDPMGVNSTKRKDSTFTMKPVDQQTFDYYIMYLQTKNSLYLTRAQRRFING